MITAKIIKDSISPVGKRITTFELEYPRFIHSELLTHRVFSRNSASSRAIPIETMIQMVIDNPAIPMWWGKNQAGMQAKEELCDNIQQYTSLDDEGMITPEVFLVTEKEKAKRLWLNARNNAITNARLFVQLGLHKQITNRILEPWTHIKVVVTSTEWDNWYNLRDHEDAQPEIHRLAEIMLDLHNNSIPLLLNYEEWHLPYVEDEVQYGSFNNSLPIGKGKIYLEDAKKLSVSLCAQVSYRRFDDSLDKAIKIYDRLISSKPAHASPTEHQATPLLNLEENSGNFKGWFQLRQEIKDNVCNNYSKLNKNKT